MAFSYTKLEEGLIGGRYRYEAGTFTNAAGGDTGGDIVTGFNTCYFVGLQYTGAAVVANVPVVNETLPFVGTSPTIKTDGGVSGTYFIIGKIM